MPVKIRNQGWEHCFSWCHSKVPHQGLISALLTRKHSEQTCEIFWSYDNRTSGNNLENFNIKILTKKYSSVCVYNFLHNWAEEKLWCASTIFVKKSVSNTHLLSNNIGIPHYLELRLNVLLRDISSYQKKNHRNWLQGLLEDA